MVSVNNVTHVTRVKFSNMSNDEKIDIEDIAVPKWKRAYDGIAQYRAVHDGDAWVDSMGAAASADMNADEKTQRFHVLVALLLSSQTKDPITSAAGV